MNVLWLQASGCGGCTMSLPVSYTHLDVYKRQSRYHAPVAATPMALVRNAPSSICGQRTIMTGPKTICFQSDGTMRPSTISCPTGTCIQELLARIQKDENIVPSATMQQAKK